jgi:hypothetical protein
LLTQAPWSSCPHNKKLDKQIKLNKTIPHRYPPKVTRSRMCKTHRGFQTHV